MRSALPKVLQPVGGRPMLAHVLDTAAALAPGMVHVIHGNGGSRVREAFRDRSVHWVEQAEPKGTGHAVMQALPDIPDSARVLVLYGDTPLVPVDALSALTAAGGGLRFLSMRPDDPDGYGRVVRNGEGRVARVVEQRDACPRELEIGEVNTGILAAPAGSLREWLGRVGNDNAQREYYLTDVIAIAVADGIQVEALVAPDATLMAGANDRWQLCRLERRYQLLQAERLCRDGALVMDPHRLDVRGTVKLGRDVVLDVNVVLEGEVELGDGVRVGPNCVLRDVALGTGTRVLANCVLESARTGTDCRIGPFARIRPDTELADGAAVGNFVEIKKSRVGPGSKINHLAYVGDAELGEGVNVGAGTITCNYDGAAKHRTVIGDRAFIGSNAALVAPVTVGADATIGAGSTISKDAPSGKLTVSRARQVTVDGWKRPKERKT